MRLKRPNLRSRLPRRDKTKTSTKFTWKHWSAIGFILTLILAFIFLYRAFFQAHSQWIPASGGIFTESTIGTLRNLNPLAPDNSLFDRDIHKLVFEGLLQHNPLSGQIEENLASFRVSDDAKTYFVTLKNSAYFSNGAPVTNEDVIFTFETVIQNPSFNNKILKAAFEYISIDVIDSRTLAFRLPEPNSFFPALLTLPILNAKSYEGALIEEITDPNYPANKKPIGAGAFLIKNIVPDDDGTFRVFLERNRYYFRGTPYIKQIVFYVYPDFEHLNFLHPWVTMFSRIPDRELDEFEKDLYGEYARREYVLPRFVGIFFNLDSPSIKHQPLRQALDMAVQKDLILDKEPGWNKIDSFFFFEGVERWHETNFPEARNTLRDNGVPFNKERNTRLLNGQPVNLRMITSVAPPVYSRFAQNLILTWKKELNIGVELTVLAPNEFQKALQDRDYDIVLFGQNFSENLDDLSTWHSSQTGKLNLSNITNKEIDNLIEEVRLTGAQTDLFELNNKLSEIVPAIAFATPQYHLLVERELFGFSDTFGKVRSHSERFSDIQLWHFFKKRAWDWKSQDSKFVGFFKWMWESIQKPTTPVPTPTPPTDTPTTPTPTATLPANNTNEN
jgi:peptide/nickel transport system substrate-binding protein